MGEETEPILGGAAAIGKIRPASELDILFRLGGVHGTEALVAALRRAVAVRPGSGLRRPWDDGVANIGAEESRSA